MKRYAFLTCGLILMFSYPVSADTISRSTEDQLQQLDQRAEKASESRVGMYAKDLLDAAKLSLTAARANAATGKEKETLLKIELASAQLDSADAKAAEKESIEKLALHRSELRKFEAQLERYRQGEAN
ncbi:MAG: hypothetical protein PHD54_04455 [Desulfuromonadaceae bacterium]|nr:hypothetical protein [Desulfuromonadaceae bacterium]